MDPRLLFEVAAWIIAAASGAVSLRISVASAALRSQSQAEISNLRLDIANLRTDMAQAQVKMLEVKAAEREELLKCLNGSFMRTPVVETRLVDIERRLQNVEDLQ